MASRYATSCRDSRYIASQCPAADPIRCSDRTGFAARSPPHVVCCMVACGRTTRNTQHATRDMQHATGNTRQATRRVRHAVCAGFPLFHFNHFVYAHVRTTLCKPVVLCINKADMVHPPSRTHAHMHVCAHACMRARNTHARTHTGAGIYTLARACARSHRSTHARTP